MVRRWNFLHYRVNSTSIPRHEHELELEAIRSLDPFAEDHGVPVVWIGSPEKLAIWDHERELRDNEESWEEEEWLWRADS
jgi:hypothetical protein